MLQGVHEYRKDIDGLRGIAVLAVVLYHAFPKAFPFGYLGVDVFFVISGYLITSIILKELQNGKFSFKEFYFRRIRRLFPALFLVLSSTFLLGYFLLTPSELESLGKHMLAGIGFVSNLVLWSEVGYFDSSTELKPLLHLWSLGVEEQFYLIWPVALVFAFKKRLNLLSLGVLIFILSITHSLVGLGQDSITSFYSPASRFWELSIGGVIAWLNRNGKTSFQAISRTLKEIAAKVLYDGPVPSRESAGGNLCSFVGLLLLFYSLMHFDGGHSDGVGYRVSGVFGTALFILAGEKSVFNRSLLSGRILVAVGLISYPLYLWHWPILAIAKVARAKETALPPSYVGGAILLSFALAAATYWLVEKPIRRMKRSDLAAKGLVALMAIPLSFGAVAFLGNGLSKRFPEDLRKIFLSQWDYGVLYRNGNCFLREFDRLENFRFCPSTRGSSGKKILLWGDSFAAHLNPGIQTYYQGKAEIVQRTFGLNCKDWKFKNFGESTQSGCDESLKYFSEIIHEIRPEVVVISSSFFLFDRALLIRAIEIARYAGKVEVFVVGPVPRWDISLPRQVFRNYVAERRGSIPERFVLGLQNEVFKFDRDLKDNFQNQPLTYISLLDILCNPTGCLVKLKEKGDALTQWDHGHFTAEGSEFVVSRFPDLLQERPN